MVNSPKPIVAAVRGACAGGGLSLALGADWIVASFSARFSCGFAAIGLIPDLGLLHTLRDRLGGGAARRLIHAKTSIDSASAYAMGLVDVVVPDEALDRTSVEEALRLADQSATAFALTKRSLGHPSIGFDDALAFELDAQEECIRSEAFRAAARAQAG